MEIGKFELKRQTVQTDDGPLVIYFLDSDTPMKTFPLPFVKEEFRHRVVGPEAIGRALMQYENLSPVDAATVVALLKREVEDMTQRDAEVFARRLSIILQQSEQL